MWSDIIEVFEQRIAEADDIIGAEGSLKVRWELLWGAVWNRGNDNNTFWGYLTNIWGELTATLRQIGQDLLTNSIKVLSDLTNRSPTIEDYQEHQKIIDGWAKYGDSILFIAHSQGNLFANVAYDHAATQLDKRLLDVIHIAPPTYKLNGPHFLADKDHVISGLLDAVGNVVQDTHIIPEYEVRNADILGHSFVDIYMNKKLYSSVNSQDMETIYKSVLADDIETAIKTSITDITANRASVYDQPASTFNRLFEAKLISSSYDYANPPVVRLLVTEPTEEVKQVTAYEDGTGLTYYLSCQSTGIPPEGTYSISGTFMWSNNSYTKIIEGNLLMAQYDRTFDMSHRLLSRGEPAFFTEVEVEKKERHDVIYYEVKRK